MCHRRRQNHPKRKCKLTPSREGKMPLLITKEYKNIKKELVENDLDVVSVIDYLNNKACK